MRVLVTDGTYKHTLGIVRQLGPRHEVSVCASRRAGLALHSRYCRHALVCPPVTEPAAYLAWLDAHLPALGIEQVIAVGARACDLLSQHRDRWAPHTRIVLPSPEQMAVALDKSAIYRLATDIGLNVPRTREPASLDQLHQAAEEVGYPLVIKAAQEGDTGVAYVETPAELMATYRDFMARYRWPYPTLPLLQQRIVGSGYGVFATYQEGDCKRLMAHRRIREFPPTGGESVCCETVYDPDLFEQGKRLLDALAWHGVAMVEFKRHLDGQYYLMEVNPKFWGSLDLPLSVGADFPGDLLAIGQGEHLAYTEHRTSGVRFCWPLGGDLQYLFKRPKAWREVLTDWLNPEVRTNLRATDPWPHGFELAQTGYRLLCH